MNVKFCEIVGGTRFEFRGRRYEKMTYEIGRDEERGGNVFHPDTEVTVEATKALCRVQERRAWRAAVRPPARTLPPRVRTFRGRLDREPGRELRRLGT
jgi:hypothetical protein